MNKSYLRKSLPRRKGDIEKLPHISRVIKALREEQHWTQEAAAKRLKISRAALARIEQGKLGVSARTLEHILAFYGKTLSAKSQIDEANEDLVSTKTSVNDFPEW